MVIFRIHLLAMIYILHIRVCLDIIDGPGSMYGDVMHGQGFGTENKFSNRNQTTILDMDNGELLKQTQEWTK